jgi:cytochrome c6
MITLKRVVAHGIFWACVGLFNAFPSVSCAADVANGQKLYTAHCAGCHGSNGISVMPQAPNLARFETATQPDQDLIDMIRSGSDKMPPYLGILNDKQILDVVSYLRTLH